MLSRSFIRPLGVAVGAGTALTAFGVATPASATVDCSSGITVDATELAINNAIADDWGLICVRPGTIDLSSSATDGDNEPIVVTNQSLHLIALGTVVFDGGNNAGNAILSFGTADEDLTIDGFTFQNFTNPSFNALAVVDLDGATGTLTVLNSSFTDNSGYAIVGATDTDESMDYGSVVVDGTVFENNDMVWSSVAGYSDITVSHSTFLGNNGMLSSAIDKWSDDEITDSLVDIHGNFFGDNNAEYDSTIYLDSQNSTIYNNTFVGNYNASGSYGSVIAYDDGTAGNLAFNTFVDNDSDFDYPNVSVGSNSFVQAQGNIFQTLADEAALEVYDVNIDDLGGNVSTNDDSAVFTDSTSLGSVTESQLALSDAADNGGSTWTVKIGANSVAQNRLTSASVAGEQGPGLAVDQRGETRGELVDSGSYDDGAAELASTGIDANGIALTGGVLGAAGVALAARRRRNRA